MMIVRVAYIATSKSRAGSRTALAASPPVIPIDRTPVHHADGELVGRLATDARPPLLTGAPMAAVVDAGKADEDWTRQPVVLVESSHRLHRGPGVARALLPVPVGDLLLEEPPAS
jgi:hypothetical protein